MYILYEFFFLTSTIGHRSNECAKTILKEFDDINAGLALVLAKLNTSPAPPQQQQQQQQQRQRSAARAYHQQGDGQDDPLDGADVEQVLSAHHNALVWVDQQLQALGSTRN